jgi:hypothetical protein
LFVRLPIEAGYFYKINKKITCILPINVLLLNYTNKTIKNKENKIMTIAKIKEILTSRFESEEDRKYWEERLKVEERKEQTKKENERYFKVNAKYNR